MKKVQLFFRDEISLGRICTDHDLKALNMYFASPEFWWDGSIDAMDKLIDRLCEEAGYIAGWKIAIIECQ